jgi:hypothetical protein
MMGPEGEDLLEMNMLDGEEEYDGEGEGEEDEDEDEDGGDGDGDEMEDEDLEGDELDFDLDEGGLVTDSGMDLDEYTDSKSTTKRRSVHRNPGKSPALGATKRPSVLRGLSNGGRGRKVEV